MGKTFLKMKGSPKSLFLIIKMGAPQYQLRDWAVVDYRLWNPVTDFELFRGPAFNLGEPYVSFLGAAQTFGCYVKKPFPALLADKSQINSLNFSKGGVGPDWYTGHQCAPLFDYINKSKFCIIQIMAAKSELMKLSKKLSLWHMSRSLWRQTPPKDIKKEISKAQQMWVQDYISLIQKIKVPIYLFDFSKRDFSFKEDIEAFKSGEKNFWEGITGSFPNFVCNEMLDQIKSEVNGYYEYKNDIGLPQKLKNRFNGCEHHRSVDMPYIIRNQLDRREFNPNKVSTVNSYYPSPEMHLGAYEVLINSEPYKSL